MRRLLFRNITQGPATERAPAPDAAALAELAAALEARARQKLGR
jgi:hypothetical protein